LKKRLESKCVAASAAGAVAPVILDGQVQLSLQYDETDDWAAKYERKLGGPARRICGPERADCEPNGIILPYGGFFCQYLDGGWAVVDDWSKYLQDSAANRDQKQKIRNNQQ
jgi:hypothetical protein